eukprot:1697106-Pyramimonas_sp.AAC.2
MAPIDWSLIRPPLHREHARCPGDANRYRNERLYVVAVNQKLTERKEMLEIVYDKYRYGTFQRAPLYLTQIDWGEDFNN